MEIIAAADSASDTTKAVETPTPSHPSLAELHVTFTIPHAHKRIDQNRIYSILSKNSAMKWFTLKKIFRNKEARNQTGFGFAAFDDLSAALRTMRTIKQVTLQEVEFDCYMSHRSFSRLSEEQKREVEKTTEEIEKERAAVTTPPEGTYYEPYYQDATFPMDLAGVDSGYYPLAVPENGLAYLPPALPVPSPHPSQAALHFLPQPMYYDAPCPIPAPNLVYAYSPPPAQHFSVPLPVPLPANLMPPLYPRPVSYHYPYLPSVAFQNANFYPPAPQPAYAPQQFYPIPPQLQQGVGSRTSHGSTSSKTSSASYSPTP